MNPAVVTRSMLDEPPDRVRLGRRMGMQIGSMHSGVDRAIAGRMIAGSAHEPGRLHRGVELHCGAVKLVAGRPLTLGVQRRIHRGDGVAVAQGEPRSERR